MGGDNHEVEQAGRTITLLPAKTITTADAGTAATPIVGLAGVKEMAIEAVFTYGSGGTKVTAYVQTSLDQGQTWVDIACFTFTTSSGKKGSKVSVFAAMSASVALTDGGLTDDTILDGYLGEQFRVKTKSTGTYAGGTTLTITAVPKA